MTECQTEGKVDLWTLVASPQRFLELLLRRIILIEYVVTATQRIVSRSTQRDFQPR